MVTFRLESRKSEARKQTIVTVLGIFIPEGLLSLDHLFCVFIWPFRGTVNDIPISTGDRSHRAFG